MLDHHDLSAPVQAGDANIVIATGSHKTGNEYTMFATVNLTVLL